MSLPLPTAANILGGFLIEVSLTLFLYGIVTAQSYIYVFNSKDDHVVLKLVVATVWALESIHSALTIHIMYAYAIVDFGKLAELGFIVWSIGLSLLLQMFIVAIVQGFFIRRIWILSRSNKIIIVTILSLLLVSRIIFGIATVTLLYIFDTWDDFRTNIGPLFTLSCGLGLSAVLDAVIAGIIIYYLRRDQAGFKSTDNVIRLILAYTINSGLITSIVSIMVVLMFFFLKHSLIFAGLVLMVGKLYSNSLLGTLNARQYLRSRMEGENVKITISPLQVNSNIRNQANHSNSMHRIHLQELHSLPYSYSYGNMKYNPSLRKEGKGFIFGTM